MTYEKMVMLGMVVSFILAVIAWILALLPLNDDAHRKALCWALILSVVFVIVYLVGQSIGYAAESTSVLVGFL